MKTKLFTLFKGLRNIVLISTSSFLCYNQLPSANENSLIYSPNDFNEELAEFIQPINYRPTIYLPDCLSQMIYSEIKAIPKVEFYREYLKTEDNGIISLDWSTCQRDPSKIETIIVLLHGLTGGSQSSYIRDTVETFNLFDKYKTVVVQYRGINKCPLTSPIGYHASQTEDIKLALTEIRKKYPNKKCICIGLSIGANKLVKLLGNYHDFDDYITALISISNPLNIPELEKRNRGSVLEKYMLKSAKEYIHQHEKILKKNSGIIIHSDHYRFGLKQNC